MHKILFAAAGLALAGASLTLSAPAQASSANAPWCAENRIGDGGTRLCNFFSFQQCRAYVQGIGGTCGQNYSLLYESQGYVTHVEPAYPRHERRQRVRHYYVD
jgi:hypothetical protein